MASAEPADLALDAALLVGAFFARDTEERVEPVVGAQGGESVGLVAVATSQYPGHGWLEVVVPHPPRHPTEVGERFDVALEECLLRLGAVRDVERPAGVRQPHHEDPHSDRHPGDGGVELAEVDLSFRARRVGLRDEHVLGHQPQLDPAAGDVPRDRHLRQGRAVFGDQALPHPPGGVPLLLRHLLVPDEPAVDDLDPRVDRRRGRFGYTFRGGGTAETSAWRTARRCTP